MIWPVTLILWHGVMAMIFGVVILATSDGPWLWFGFAFVASSLATLVPRVWVGPDGVRARNFLRRRRWAWDEIDRIAPRRTGVFFTRGLGLGELEVHDGHEAFPLSATMARRLEQAVAHLSSDAAARQVPVDHEFQDGNEAAEEWARRRQAQQRLDELRRGE